MILMLQVVGRKEIYVTMTLMNSNNVISRKIDGNPTTIILTSKHTHPPGPIKPSPNSSSTIATTQRTATTQASSLRTPPRLTMETMIFTMPMNSNSAKRLKEWMDKWSRVRQPTLGRRPVWSSLKVVANLGKIAMSRREMDSSNNSSSMRLLTTIKKLMEIWVTCSSRST